MLSSVLWRAAAIAGMAVWASASHGQTTVTSVPATTVSSTGTAGYHLNRFCQNNPGVISDGDTSYNRSICLDYPVDPGFTLNLGFSQGDRDMLTGLRVWANSGNVYSDHELREFDLEIDYFDPASGQTVTATLRDVNIGDTIDRYTPLSVSVGGPYFRVSEVRMFALEGLPSGSRRRTTFREVQGLFTDTDLAPAIQLSDVGGTVLADGGTDAQGTQVTDEAQTITYTIRNVGTGPMDLSTAISTSNLVNIDGAVSIGAPGQSTLQSGEETTFTVTYAPDEEAPYSFDLAIDSGVTGSTPFGLTVSGAGNDAPTATITGPSTPQGDPFPITVTFSEDVTGLELSDFAIVNGSVSNLVTTSASVYTLTVTPTTAGQNVMLTLPANSVVDADGAPNTAPAAFMATSGALTTTLENTLREVLQEEVENSTRLSLKMHQRWAREARERFAAERQCRQGESDAAGADQMTAACGAGYEHVPLRFGGDISATQNSSFLRGSFFGLTGSLDEKRRRLISGDFDVTQIDGEDTLMSFTGRVAWEITETEDMLVGSFISASAERAEIGGSLGGTRDGYGLQLGFYAVEAYPYDLYVDGFATFGLGQNAVALDDGFFEVSGDYLVPSIQAGLALSGERDLGPVLLRPTVSLAYGYAYIGEVEVEVKTPTSTVMDSLDADDLYLGLLAVTPEMILPLEGGSGILETAELRAAPALTCEFLTLTEQTGECGGGLGLEFSAFSDDRAREISARVGYEVIGDSERSSFGLTLASRF